MVFNHLLLINLMSQLKNIFTAKKSWGVGCTSCYVGIGIPINCDVFFCNNQCHAIFTAKIIMGNNDHPISLEIIATYIMARSVGS